MNGTKGLLVVVILVAAGLFMAGCGKKSEVTGPVAKPADAVASSTDYMRLSFVEGDVLMKAAGVEDWGFATKNYPVGEGDEFWVLQNGRLEIQLKSGTYIRLDKESSIQMLTKEKDSVQFWLDQGHAYVVHDAPEGSVTQVDTASSSTSVLRNSIFRVDLTDDKYTEVGVYKEHVATGNEVGKIDVTEGNMVFLGLRSDGKVAPMGPPDEWEKWNQLRNNNLFNRGDTVKTDHLPGELKTYSSDLDNNGKWMQVPEYGTVWTPTVGVGADWAPYKDGTWVWRNNDYVWVASEQWGWAPYHYGRWAFVAGTGWCWVPPASGDVYWSPGYVGWVRTDDYVAWVPLAPGEIYYGRGDYGTNSVNIVNTNMKQVVVPNGYMNVQVNNAATVVSLNTFGTASPRIERLDQRIIQEKVFRKDNISVGTPAIKPTRASYYASAKIVPAEKLPPQSVRELNIKELKQSRHLIKEPNQSVFSAGKPIAQLPVHKVETPIIRGKSTSATLGGSPEVKGLDGKQKNEKDHNPKVNAVRDQNKITGQQPGKTDKGKLGDKTNQTGGNTPKVKAVQSLGRDQKKITGQQPGKADERKLGDKTNQTGGNTPKVKAVQSLGRNQDQMTGRQAGKADVRGQNQVKNQQPTVGQQKPADNRGQNQVKNQQPTVGQQKPADNRGQNQVKNQQPTVGQQKPAGNGGQNQVKQKQPTAGQQKPAADKKADDKTKKQKKKDGEKDDKK